MPRKRTRLMTEKTVTYYFGYGSNLWKDQMKRRCPKSTFIGVGELKGWKWIINERGYANIIPSSDHIVQGFIYELTQQDEEKLDNFETAYDKMHLPVKVLSSSKLKKGAIESVMSYVDEKCVTVGPPKEEYIVRMNNGIADGIEEGISEEYFERNVRPFLR